VHDARHVSLVHHRIGLSFLLENSNEIVMSISLFKFKCHVEFL
jgi:hypothetical protein